MRICSLLPSLTEVLFAVGAGPDVVAVTHECDWPPEAARLPSVTKSRIEGRGLTSTEIDQAVSANAGSLYDLDVDRLRQLKPDLIVTQQLCEVCAVSEPLVREAAATLPGPPAVESFEPTTLDEVLDSYLRIGDLAGCRPQADRLHAHFREEIARLQRATSADDRPKALVLEWIDPPFSSGHWTPQLVEIAGGRECLGRSGQPSRRITWEEIRAADPDTIVVAPCGYTQNQALAETGPLANNSLGSSLSAVRNRRVFVADGSAYFNRPGPRLLDTLYLLVEALHPERAAGLVPTGGLLHLDGEIPA